MFSRSVRWWVFLPLLLPFLIVGWEHLGGFLGYDIFPATDYEPPRFQSSLLEAAFYAVWWSLFFLIIVPGTMIAAPLGYLLPATFRYGVTLALPATFYTAILFAISLRRGARQVSSPPPAT